MASGVLLNNSMLPKAWIKWCMLLCGFYPCDRRKQENHLWLFTYMGGCGTMQLRSGMHPCPNLSSTRCPPTQINIPFTDCLHVTSIEKRKIHSTRENCVRKNLPYFFALFCQTEFYDKEEKYAHETQFMQIPQNGGIGQQQCLHWCSQESSLQVWRQKYSQPINFDGQLTRLVDYFVFIITFYMSRPNTCNKIWDSNILVWHFSRDQNILVKITFRVTVGVPNTATFAIFHSCSFILQRKPCDNLQQIIPFSSYITKLETKMMCISAL